MVFCTEFLDGWWSWEPLRRSCVRCGWCCARHQVGISLYFISGIHFLFQKVLAKVLLPQYPSLEPKTEYNVIQNIIIHNLLLLLLWRYDSDRVLAFSTISFHLERSCTCSAHFISYIFFRSFLTSSSHRDLGLPAGLPMNGFHLIIHNTVLISALKLCMLYPSITI